MQAPPPEPFAGSYLDATAHLAMLQDVVRTSAYADALKKVVRAESRVIDFGTGSGALAIFAARAGAKQVDAVERTRFVEKARAIALASGHPEIRFHHADHESFAPDGQADVLVSEWMGHFLFFEAMLTPLLTVRKRWLKPGGVMIPARVTAHAALLTEESYFENLAFLQGNPYGIDFSPIADVPLQQTHLVRVQPHELYECPFDLGTLDMATLDSSPELLSAQAEIERSATVFGIVAWFSAELAEGISFGTGPDDADTHWEQMFLPFPEPFELRAGRTITLRIRPAASEEPNDPWAWSISDGKRTVEVRTSEEFP